MSEYVNSNVKVGLFNGVIGGIALKGNLGKSPEMKYTQSGKAFCKFSLAVSQGFGDTKNTVWFDVTMWGKSAESANANLHKGDSVMVEVSEFGVSVKAGETNIYWKVSSNGWSYAGAKGAAKSSEQEAGDYNNYGDAPADTSDIPF